MPRKAKKKVEKEKPPPKKRGRKPKPKTNVEKPPPKKRGRKPKGGKIIKKNQKLTNTVISKTPNVILHLKCSSEELNNINNNQKEETMILKQKPIQYHKPCILLTTYNESSRTKMYEKRIEWWVENTKLPIYIVDSFNTGFDTLLEKYKSTNRLFCYKFDQKKFIRSRRFHQTKYEILSLKQAYEHFKSDWDKYTLIIKVTGKYVLPRFDTLIDEIPVENDFLVQYKHKIRWQNTEYLGFKLEKMLKILGELDDSMVFERTLRPLLDKYKTKRLGLIYIPKEYRTPTKQGFTYSSL